MCSKVFICFEGHLTGRHKYVGLPCRVPEHLSKKTATVYGDSFSSGDSLGVSSFG